VVLTVENGPLLLRAAHFDATVSLPDSAGLSALRGVLQGAGYGALASDLTAAAGKRYQYSTVGMLYDGARLQLQAEAAWRNGREASYVPDAAAWYAMAAYRFGAWLPYVSHARLRQTGTSLSVPPGFPTTGPLSGAVRDGVLTGPEQYSNLIGVRWNVAPSRALKLQLDRVRPTVKNGTLAGGPAAGLKSGVTVLSLALEAVFQDGAR
jgi:hypothetical protein